MKTFLILIGMVSVAGAQDLSGRVRKEILNQTFPITVNVSTDSSTAIEFPAPVQAVASAQFTAKANENTQAQFYYGWQSGANWMVIQSMKEHAEQNFTIVIYGRVYEINCKTTTSPDFSIIFSFGEPEIRRSRQLVWIPTRKVQ